MGLEGTKRFDSLSMQGSDAPPSIAPPSALTEPTHNGPNATDVSSAAMNAIDLIPPNPRSTMNHWASPMNTPENRQGIGDRIVECVILCLWKP